MTFYIQSDNDEIVLLSNNVTDTTGGAIDIAGKIGTVSGDIITAAEIEDLQNNLYFELQTINLNGEKNEYQLRLTLTEVTGKADAQS